MYFEKEKYKKINKNTRTFVSVFLVLAIIFVYSVRLLQLQVVNYGYYHRQANIQSAQTVAVKAARGEILDRYGRPIAVNRDGYNIVFDASYLSMPQVNSIINTLINLLQNNKDEWRDKLPISDAAPYSFTDDDSSADVSALKSKLELNHYATAQNCFDTMVEKYSLQNYSSQKQRLIMGVRYSMEAEDFSVSYPYTFAEDISENTRSRVLEAATNYPGVKIEESAVREYVAGDILAQIVGTTGPIYAEDWEKLKSKGYSYSDYVGKSGVEAAFEDYLRGKDGTNRVIQDGNGKTLEVVTQDEAVAGNTVMLTIDLNIQRVAQDSLAKLINDMHADNVNASSGSVVVMNVNSGDILAAANYPSYTYDQYQNEYDKLSSDKSLPLFNRAFNGTYPPGSTFKPAVAAIGISTGAIAKNETIYCKRNYDYYKDIPFQCMHYHGSIDVINALSKSCNYFFYETGRRCGIDTLNKYCQLLGLGSKTGVELSESSGTLAGPAYAKSINAVWHPGDTLQASIGQSYNLFTPLQLATYTSTIANGGTRYQSHLLYQVKSYNLTDTVSGPTATVAAETGLSADALQTAKNGMLSAAFEGTAASVFGNYSIQVGGKTGTAETVGENNGVFISFAPYKNTEIAVAIVVEHGLQGYRCAPVVKDIFDAYFFSKNENAKNQDINLLLS